MNENKTSKFGLGDKVFAISQPERTTPMVITGVMFMHEGITYQCEWWSTFSGNCHRLFFDEGQLRLAKEGKDV